MAAQEISLEAMELLKALLHRDYVEAQFRASYVARHAMVHEHQKVADAAGRIERLLQTGSPDACELGLALRLLARSVDHMQAVALRRAGRLL